jgi:hypothetical protein
MKPKEILKLAVQLLGLVFLYHGLQALPVAVIQFCTAVPSMNIGSMFSSLVMAAWPLAVAYWLLRGAPLIMRIASADMPATTKDETKIEGVFGQKADV